MSLEVVVVIGVIITLLEGAHVVKLAQEVVQRRLRHLGGKARYPLSGQ